jgi:hypothetical protein
VSTLDPNLRCAFGDPDHQNESFRNDERDPRWEAHRIRRFDRGRPVAELQVRRAAGSRRPSGLLGEAVGSILQTAGLSENHQVVSVGATARYRGGGLVTRRESPWQAITLLEELVTAAANEAAARDAVLVAPQVPAPQVAGFVSALPGDTRIFPGHQWSSMDTRGAQTSEQFLARHPTAVRQTWRKDQDTWADTGLRVQVTDWDEAVIEEAAPLVAHVSLKNGTPEDERLVPWRLSRWRQDTPGRHLVAVVREAGRLVGACFFRLARYAVDAYDIGLVADHPYRHAVYTELIVHTPVRLALEAGAERVDLGVGHPLPKQRRGADATPQWNLLHVPAGVDALRA